jgi:hypothetical protein
MGGLRKLTRGAKRDVTLVDPNFRVPFHLLMSDCNTFDSKFYHLVFWNIKGHGFFNDLRERLRRLKNTGLTGTNSVR